MHLDDLLRGSARPDDGSALVEAAALLGVEPVVLRAVMHVETDGRAFLPDRSVIHRFEPHVFDRTRWRLSDTLCMSFSKRLRLFREAFAVDEVRALKATSFGVWQIMGFNHTAAGYASPAEMVSAFSDSERAQILAGARFIKAAGLDSALRAEDWSVFAVGYNGPARVEIWSQRLARAVSDLRGSPSPAVLSLGDRGEAVSRLQRALRIEADGFFGIKTERAVREFQARHSLAVDGVAGAQTWAALHEAGSQSVPVSSPDLTARLNVVRSAAQTATVASGGVVAVRESLPPPFGDGLAVFVVSVAVVAGAVYLVRRFILKGGA